MYTICNNVNTRYSTPTEPSEDSTGSTCTVAQYFITCVMRATAMSVFHLS